MKKKESTKDELFRYWEENIVIISNRTELYKYDKNQQKKIKKGKQNKNINN